MAHKLGADWRREFRFVIPVRDPDRWSSPEVTGSLERLLAFMSDDRVRFEFTRARDPPSAGDYFDLGSEKQQVDTADEVALFSGGLDSLTGAVDRLCHGTSRLLLVGHRSSTKMADRQRHLAHELATRFPGRVLHVPVQVTKHGLAAVETTQRSRSFLFGALGIVVARVVGAADLTFFENGIVSFNLPIASQVVGAAATRSTHPRVMRDLTSFVSTLLDQEFRVSNPYLWKTKTDVAKLLPDAGHADLARHTVSCSHVYAMTRLHTHCGCCSQCLDRRFAALAAGLGDDPQEMYETDLLTGARERAEDRTMAESFVRHVLDLHGLAEHGFMAKFGGEVARAMSCVPGMSASEVARAMLDLHLRHADAVISVLEDGYHWHASELAVQMLPSSSILRMVAGSEGIAKPAPAPLLINETPPADTRDFRRSSQIRLALDPQAKLVLIEGVPPIAGSASFALIRALAAAHEKDREARRAPENYTFLEALSLAQALEMSDASLRRCVYRLRRRIAEAFEKSAGLAVSGEALIENRPWRGYRLNPTVLIVAADELRPR